MLGFGSISQFPISDIGAASAPTPVPFVATSGAKSLKRRNTTHRNLRQLEQPESTPLAPSRAAPLSEQFITVLSRSRRVQVAQWFAGLAAVPVTPVPLSAWVTPPAKRERDHTNRVRRDVLKASYYAPTPAPTPVGWSVSEPFVTNTTRSRKLLTAAIAPVFPAAQPAVPVAALFAPKTLRRKSGVVGFVAADETYGGPPPVIYPSFKPVGFIKRRDTKKYLRKALIAPVFTATPPNTSKALNPSFITHRTRSRKLLTVPPMVIISAPTPPPIVVIDTHDGDTLKKRHQKEIEDRQRRRAQIVELYEELVELKPKSAQEIIAPFVPNAVQSQNASIDFDSVLENLESAEVLYFALLRELQELDDEDILLLL